ncbi:uncharacterized protein LOC141537697 [Cotesia typhae]|uniref:uncharacterized protein LOC141537697 n=1 Tax=Cotesia typhae TaxID=2053667 RepID=UPI003D68FD29
MNESTKELVKIGKPLSNNSPQINRPITTTDNDLIQVDDSTKSTTSSETSQTQKNTCENCKDCICRPWRSNLTPEYTTLFGLQANSFNKYISKKNLTASQKLKIELHPNTGIFISENEINLALSKSNYKHRELVRQLLSLIITNEELIAFKTAENMNKNNPNIRNAIIGYLKSECDVSLTIVEFNDIVRRKIDQAVINQKPLDEIQKIKSKNIERALTSRSKRKLLSKENSSIVSKKVKDSDDTLGIEPFLHSESKDRDDTSQNKTSQIIHEDLSLVNINDNHEQSTESFIGNDNTSGKDKGTDVIKVSEIGNQQNTNKIEQTVTIENLEEDKPNGLEKKTNHQQNRPVKESATNLEQPKNFSANNNCPNPPFSQLENNTQTSLTTYDNTNTGYYENTPFMNHFHLQYPYNYGQSYQPPNQTMQYYENERYVPPSNYNDSVNNWYYPQQDFNYHPTTNNQAPSSNSGLN